MLNQILVDFPYTEAILAGLGFDLVADREKALDEVCRAKGLDPRTVVAMLGVFEATAPAARVATAELMSFAELCDHIVNVQHVLVRHELARLDRICREMDLSPEIGTPRLRTVQKQFAAFRAQLADHLREEAEVLFPLIRQLDSDRWAETGVLDLLKASMAGMEREHDEVDEGLAELETLIESNASSSSGAGFLQEFHDVILRLERLLHGQIYQENQILFRRARALLESQ